MADKTQGTRLQIETASLTPDVITGITAANPPVVTSASHGIATSKIVRVASVAGMFQVNNRCFVTGTVATNTLELKGIDGTGYNAYTSGGTVTELTMTDIGEVTGIPTMFDGTADDIDVTNLQSVEKEFLIGLPDAGNVTLELTLANVDVGQAALLAAKISQVAKGFAIISTTTKIAAFNAFVKSFSISAAGNEAYRASVALKLRAAPAYFA